MDQYCIISGTNRAGSTTLKIAEFYLDHLSSLNIQSSLFSLENWNFLHRNRDFQQLESEKLVPANKFIFISPEYNGSIPGVLKVMIDITDHRKVWAGKKALLTGISSGRAGNLRGMDHLTGILNYLQVVVHPNKLPISSVDHLLNGEGKLADTGTLHAIRDQVKQFISF